MPKIIENVRELLLDEAKRQIAENGYARTTIRSVATACGLGVGTVYNYFKSKDVLIASFMLDDWQECIQKMRREDTNDTEAFLRCIYLSLQDFAKTHTSLFRDSDAAKVFATVFAERHKLLRDQLADIVLPICEQTGHVGKRFLAEFVSESLLTWTMAEKPFEDIYAVLCLLLKN
ncbi:MAG: TetR/AcrR family transcriptional regulator [Clostridia bacterium]|nr:TetR/AcrR family transcriptional regulator [Clostridia bacterium]